MINLLMETVVFCFSFIYSQKLVQRFCKEVVVAELLSLPVCLKELGTNNDKP